MKIDVKGTIISNDQKWLYDMFEMDSTAPKDIALPENGEQIDVTINSGGGDVYAGSEIYTKLKSYSGPVNIQIVGIAASAASVIAMAGSKVSISPTAQIMIHNVSAVVGGDHKALSHEANVLQNYNTSIANAYVAKTGKSMDDLLNLMDKETWFNAQQAVSEGFADEVMFSNEKAVPLVASLSPVIPADAVEKLMNKVQSTIKKQDKAFIDVDAIANSVIEKLNTKSTIPKSEKSPFERYLF
ncbi:head maturation protease, ClpP-related [Vagococcus entomophilus]|uniref:ATP-dependent Clp protease proteolytic subunit n=1 Tax=Vagococcus entomophilus TaxID=1160095 RepID=A0A430AK41_9ENTE|nr:head maturation protease, ClpP-related [Vagococcus entomophilus]RSU08438.1 peptidase [Vagococcus entomophilus]